MYVVGDGLRKPPFAPLHSDIFALSKQVTCRRGIRGPAGAIQEFDTGIQAGCVVDVYRVAIQQHQELYVSDHWPASRLRGLFGMSQLGSHFSSALRSMRKCKLFFEGGYMETDMERHTFMDGTEYNVITTMMIWGRINRHPLSTAPNTSGTLPHALPYAGTS